MASIRRCKLCPTGRSLAVLNALQGAHRVTNDVDTVAEQHGDHPTVVEIALMNRVDELEGISKVDCIAVGDTPASSISASDLPDEELDRAFGMVRNADPIEVCGRSTHNRRGYRAIRCGGGAGSHGGEGEDCGRDVVGNLGGRDVNAPTQYALTIQYGCSSTEEPR